MKQAVFLCATLLLLAGCSTSPSSSFPASQAKTVAPATPEQAAMLEKMKSLAGTWEMADEKGQKAPIVFAVTSGGSAVREIMFPGAPHEMTNVYHLDGPSLMAVHYCATGNQPHMRATTADADRIEFKFDSVTNKTASDQNYMGQLTIIFKDKDHIREEWQSLKNGKNDEFVAFDLERKKGA